ncbi:hypothetical protein CLOBY_00430 [Clostridium saccharobutylicum]|uniref:Card1-like endonuclease domain-containing protein n=1 Tax=Clostridium saccharobutylicum TaxID=169679 RepID=UPI000983FCCD|nr:DUF1887 family CARF protein [Clostridium saccharobutylicum]AQS07994.1 hypothetical protein CLOBY_00430 [Clostridium saccharobutylicum]MBC2436970.1 DUF1887 family protein [Clostridium saccharobutylicum]NSB89322.1 hypothetical protein [Clostridium saccharobutylicum]OOM17325.1 hypothetical protein CLSAB_17500 [Clostridium saccharobutylicum]
MKTETLVNFFDTHNEGSLLAIDKLRPNRVIYIRNSETESIYKEIERYEKYKFSDIEFKDYLVDEGDIERIDFILSNLSKDNTIINVTGGKRINALILLNQAVLQGFNIIYVDVLNKQWYSFGQHINKDKNEFYDIHLEDMLKLTGTNLLVDSTSLSEKKDIISLTKQIYNNLDLWHKYKQKLYDNKVFLHDYSNPRKININLKDLTNEEINILHASLKYLEKLKDINYKNKDREIEVNFLNDYLKGFIFKSGTWLEVLTNMVVREITEIDEVKSGVVFLWKECEQRVKNELDVLAVKDSVLICISCKDSEKYDENALNELDVYSKRLGGNVARKILVATKLPSKECINDRAKAMGINLVILDRDINKFKNILRRIINI